MLWLVGVIPLVLFVAALGFTSLKLRRNEWVYQERTRLIREFHDKRVEDIYNGIVPDWRLEWDDDYLSYDEMMKKFWVWDIEKLRK